LVGSDCTVVRSVRKQSLTGKDQRREAAKGTCDGMAPI
jgi:hypothetical protein